MTHPPETSADKPQKRVRSLGVGKRARFLDGFPEHEGLSRAVTAFENGNYAETRRLCEQLLESEQDEDVRDAANELLRRMQPDRMIVVILWASFALLALVALSVYGHGH
jgi:hypothetical protein